MKRWWSVAAGLAVALFGVVESAQAEDIALSFEGPPVVAAVAVPKEKNKTESVGLSFEPKPVALTPAPTSQFAATVTEPSKQQADTQQPSLDELFAGGAHSLVAKAVGSAEGTRAADGDYTAAYYGHIDPGNGKWNQGSFSYQHGASSPAEADGKQLRRLKSQAAELRRQASAKQLTLSLLEELNGIDLANQAPLAALDRGYIAWLHQARELPMAEPDRVVWARTRAFIDPDSGRWNAPGLGNTLASITQDQERRQKAVQKAIEEYLRQ
ncbi:MAG: hypothetical protein AAGF01_12590 [Cyanobacteria bacterium P01_G01_bin.38]